MQKALPSRQYPASPPAPVATAAKAQGIIIYCIGLIGSDGLDISALNDWATDPDASHVAVTPDTADLEALFAQLAANISKPGATDIIINEAVNPDFVTLLFLKLKIPAPCNAQRHESVSGTRTAVY